MKFLKLSPTTKLSELADRVGNKNIDTILHANQLTRTPDIGSQYAKNCNIIVTNNSDVTWQRKVSVLNSLTSDSDIFESAAVQGASGWKLLSTTGNLPGYITVPETIIIPDADDILGNGKHVFNKVYNRVLNALKTPPHTIPPDAFSEYSNINVSQFVDPVNYGEMPNSFNEMLIPWGKITLASSLTTELAQFPVYPVELSDKVSATYTTMPDMLYQYEPWQIYQSSGPRSNSYTFEFHRDMWGDHRQGGANALIRYCMANCYPNYSGALIQTPTVTLYINGSALIHGVMTDVSVDWDGPLGLDGWYLHCKLTLSITEVSTEPLNFNTMKRKPLIG